MDIKFSEEQFREVWDTISPVVYGTQALLRWPEAALLYMLARDVQTNGVVVELGSHLGGSTMALGLGCKEYGGALVSVDMWTDDHAGQVKWSESNDLLPTFWRNVRDHGLDSLVVPMRGKTQEVPWDSPIRLLFIDADHSYEGVRGDFERWSKFVWHGGAVVFHDYEIEPGVTRLVNELRGGECDFEFVGRACSCAVFERKAGTKTLWPW